MEFLGDHGVRPVVSCRIAQPGLLGDLTAFDVRLDLPHFALVGSGTRHGGRHRRDGKPAAHAQPVRPGQGGLPRRAARAGDRAERPVGRAGCRARAPAHRLRVGGASRGRRAGHRLRQAGRGDRAVLGRGGRHRVRAESQRRAGDGHAHCRACGSLGDGYTRRRGCRGGGACLRRTARPRTRPLRYVCRTGREEGTG